MFTKSQFYVFFWFVNFEFYSKEKSEILKSMLFPFFCFARLLRRTIRATERIKYYQTLYVQKEIKLVNNYIQFYRWSIVLLSTFCTYFLYCDVWRNSLFFIIRQSFEFHIYNLQDEDFIFLNFRYFVLFSFLKNLRILFFVMFLNCTNYIKNLPNHWFTNQ